MTRDRARKKAIRETDVAAQERQERPRPGPVGRLARRVARAVWERLSPEVDAAELGEMFREALRRTVGVGLVEPAERRYQVDFGAYAQVYFDGQLWGGPPGAPLRAGNRGRQATEAADDPLGALGLLRAVTQARYCGEEVLRGTPCRAVAVRAGAAAFTVWIDDEHVRRIESEWHGRGPHRGRSTKTTRTFELWDFGVPAGTLDWSHLPSFRSPG